MTFDVIEKIPRYLEYHCSILKNLHRRITKIAVNWETDWLLTFLHGAIGLWYADFNVHSITDDTARGQKLEEVVICKLK